MTSPRNPTWNGDCNFSADADGSFFLRPTHGSFVGGISDLTVRIEKPGVAEVRGLTSAGINSMWGEAKRSTKDGACWLGEDFSVCAYAPGTEPNDGAKPARCYVSAAGTSPWEGDCRFRADEKGSFVITPTYEPDFQEGILDVNLWITAPGVAEVRGVTSAGINSRWGEAKRSTTDGACWVGDGFTVCAY